MQLSTGCHLLSIAEASKRTICTPMKISSLSLHDDAPFAALAFKIMTDPYVGRLTFIRIYSGTLTKGMNLINSTKDSKERISRLLEMHANKRKDRDEFFTGDIAACIGLKKATTGDTLCSPDKPLLLEKMEFPEPVISMAIEPKSKADREKLAHGALSALSEEDPTFRVSTNEETGQTIIAGMGELHLEILHDRMKREFSVEANVGKPQVAYKETITIPGKIANQIRQAVGRPRSVRSRRDSKSNRMKKAKATRSSARLSAALFQKNTSRRPSKGLKKGLPQAFWQAISLVDVKVAIVYRFLPRCRL